MSATNDLTIELVRKLFKEAGNKRLRDKVKPPPPEATEEAAEGETGANDDELAELEAMLNGRGR